MEPTASFKGHAGPVTDVAWNIHAKSVFASVGEDRMLLLYHPAPSKVDGVVPQTHAVNVRIARM